MSARNDVDAQLSAWIDGELPEAEAQALAQRVAREPELARRAEALRQVDARLRGLPAPATDPALRERLEARLAAGEGDAARVVALRRRRRWALPAAAALAAGLALYLSTRSAPPSSLSPELPPLPAIVRGPESEPDAERTPLQPDLPTPGSAPEAIEIAREPAPEAIEIAREPAPEAMSEPALPSAEDAADDELALALDYELLRDFEVIDQLELLEVLAAYEELEGEGRS